MRLSVRQKRILAVVLIVAIGIAAFAGWPTLLACLLVVFGLIVARRLMSVIHQIPDEALRWIAEKDHAEMEAKALNKALEEKTAPASASTRRPTRL